eukprot:scaffold15154_cov75-Phaeocystis_antarctica.AAC.1
MCSSGSPCSRSPCAFASGSKQSLELSSAGFRRLLDGMRSERDLRVAAPTRRVREHEIINTHLGEGHDLSNCTNLEWSSTTNATRRNRRSRHSALGCATHGRAPPPHRTSQRDEGAAETASAALLHRTRLSSSAGSRLLHKLHVAACAVLCGGHQKGTAPHARPIGPTRAHGRLPLYLPFSHSPAALSGLSAHALHFWHMPQLTPGCAAHSQPKQARRIMAAFLKDKNAEKPKKPMTDYQLFCHWMKSDESVGVQDPDTGEAIPLKDLHFTKQQKWFSKCWKGELTFPPGGIKIAGLKFKTLSEMKAYFHSKYNTLQEQWHKEKAAWEKQK